jgi:gas vesicle protein
MDNATGNVFADTKLRIQDAKRAMNTTAKLVEEQARTPLHHSPSFIDKIKNWWSENVTEKFRGVSDKVKDAFTSVKDWVTDGFTNVKDAFFDIVTSIKDAIADAFKTVKDKIKTAVDAFKEKVKEGLEVVGEGLSEFKKGLTQVGKSLLDGFKDFLNIDVEDFVEMQETLASNLRGKMMDRAKQYFDDIQEEGK